MAKREKRNRIIVFIVLIVIAFVQDLPLISMYGTAFKTPEQALSSTQLIPALGEWSLDSFRNVLANSSFGQNVVSSLLASTGTTLLCTMVAMFAGYALSRYRGRFFSCFSVLLIIIQMLPVMLLLIPTYMLYTKLNLMDSIVGIILIYTTQNMAFSIMLIRGFFDAIPKTLEEAARIDGCSDFKIFLKIIVPISLPGIGAVGIFTFLNSWNEYTYACLMLRNDAVKTVTIGMSQFISQSGTNYSSLMAAASIATVPAVIFLVFAQKYLVTGLTAGAVKE